jgi:mannose-6-phosphate isomerase-like protein (cupin superfamily)
LQSCRELRARAASQSERSPKLPITRRQFTSRRSKRTETYFILECGSDAKMQLDDELIPLRQGMCVRIPPGVRHRAIGTMKILNIVIPKFDPSDEHFD